MTVKSTPPKANIVYGREVKDFSPPWWWKLKTRFAAPQAGPVLKLCDISGLGQTKVIASAFPAMKAGGWEAIMIRATDGLVPDTLFDYFWRAAVDAGLFVIAYHAFYAYASTPPISQASQFLKTIDPLIDAQDGHILAMCDVEVRDQVTVAARQKAFNTFWSYIPLSNPIDYSSRSRWLELMGNMPLPADHIGHVASWNDGPAYMPVGWTLAQTRFRQKGVYLHGMPWVDKDPPPGVHEDVDVNEFNGSITDLKALAGVQPAPPPEPAPDLAELWDYVHGLNDSLIAFINKNDTEHLYWKEQIARLQQRMLDLGAVPYALFDAAGDGAVVQVISKYNSSSPQKPIFVPLGDAPHPKVAGINRVFPLPVTGDGGQVCYMLLAQIGGATAYVRKQDGALVVK